MKKFLLILFVFLFGSVCAEENLQPINQNLSTMPQNVSFENCIKFFDVNKEKLFFLTLSSINANKYNTDEIQTANGYIIFTANRRKFLATVAGVDSLNSVLKITPCNNIYNFAPYILENIFKYIELNSKGNS